jgi:hypothetical protein
MSFHSKIVEIQQRRDRDEFEQKVRKITKEDHEGRGEEACCRFEVTT